MRIILVATLAFALCGCFSAPVVRTAANDDACLQASVRPSVVMPPITASDPKASPTKCEPMSATWRGLGGYRGGESHGEGH